MLKQNHGLLCNIGYPSETHLKLNSRKISFIHNIRLNNPIGLKSCTKNISITAVFCVKFQNDWMTEIDNMDERDLRDLSLRWVSVGYPVLHNTPEGCLNTKMPSHSKVVSVIKTRRTHDHLLIITRIPIPEKTIFILKWDPGVWFTNVSRAIQNDLANIFNARNHIYDGSFKLKLCTCAQSMALGVRTKFQLEIAMRSRISAIHKFRENILESSRNVSETTTRFVMVSVIMWCLFFSAGV